jgi:DNA modification methylase
MPKDSYLSHLVEGLSVDALKPNPKNPRIHKPAHVRQIARSIKSFGFGPPILADQDLMILSGHGRLLAAKQLGMAEVPVIRLQHLTPAEAQAFALAENKLVETGAWDQELLADQFRLLSGLDLEFDLEDTGFSIAEIDPMLVEEPAAPEEEPEALVVEARAITQPGDLWRLGKHRLLCGDATDAASYAMLLGKAQADAVLTDPPYGVPIDGFVSGRGRRKHREFAMGVGEMSDTEFEAFLERICRLMAEHSRDGAVHMVFMDWRHIRHLLQAGHRIYDQLLNVCVWFKGAGGLGSLYRSSHELIAVFRHGKTPHRNNVELGRHGRDRWNTWQYPGAAAFLRSSEDADLVAQHPTPKAILMLVDAILDVTARGEIVLDPFLGSGSLIIAAERTGRRAFGMELDPLYVDLCIRRWQRFTGEHAVLERTGDAFDALSHAGDQ